MSSKNSHDSVIIIVEYPQELKMTYRCIIGDRSWSVLSLLEYMKKYVKDAITLYIPKNKTTVNGNKKIGELYDQYHDREDGLLYLAVLSSDPF